MARGLFDFNTAFLGSIGGAAAKLIINRTVGAQIGDPRFKGLAVMAAGSILAAIPLGSRSMRQKLAVGGQIAGAQMILESFAPQFFGSIVPEFEVAGIGQPGGVPLRVPPGTVEEEELEIAGLGQVVGTEDELDIDVETSMDATF